MCPRLCEVQIDSTPRLSFLCLQQFETVQYRGTSIVKRDDTERSRKYLVSRFEKSEKHGNGDIDISSERRSIKKIVTEKKVDDKPTRNKNWPLATAISLFNLSRLLVGNIKSHLKNRKMLHFRNRTLQFTIPERWHDEKEKTMSKRSPSFYPFDL